jgi:2-polyprenyl-6-methoxyphenol hydroxylase-like FAD-dependent oxidoreductase
MIFLHKFREIGIYLKKYTCRNQTMQTETISIIGAGIGGLTTALALQQKGLKVTVFESAPAIKPVGAGIMLANNAMQVYNKLGIRDKIEEAGNRISYMKITDHRLSPISVIDLTRYEKEYGVHSLAIHRGELQKILADAIGPENIALSKRLSSIEKNEVFRLAFEDHSVIESNIVIGADGIKSVIRNQLFEKSSIRNANQLCWRGICEFDLPDKYHHEANEAWGKGKRFGFVKISDRKVYWYALRNGKEEKKDEEGLPELFREFHTDILQIIAATKKEDIIVNEITDLKPIATWQDRNICLVGDAAHATTPNLGQGACQAIEDAYVLGNLIQEGVAIGTIFEKYESLRRKKAHRIVSTSWQIGKISQIENDFGIWLRNLLLRSLPDAANKKQMDMIFKLD